MIQKRYLLGFLIGTICLAACSNDADEMGNEDSTNIRLAFNIKEELQTRGTIIEGSGAGKLFNGNLKLFTVENEGTASIEFSQVCKIFSISNGTCDTKQKWPNDGLTFYAFAPSTATYTDHYPTTKPTVAAVTSTTYSAGTYQLKAYAAQEDLLFAKTGIRTLASDGINVPLTLNHILSRVTFQIRTEDFNAPGEKVLLKQIILENVCSEATGTFGNGVANPATGFKWTHGASKIGTYKMEFATDAQLTDDTSGKSLDNSAFGTAADSYLKVTDAAGNSMFMFPHENSNFNTYNTKLTIKYKVASDGASAPARTFTANLKELKNADKSTPHCWNMSEWTNYQFTIKANYIVLDAITVADWNGPHHIEIPVN